MQQPQQPVTFVEDLWVQCDDATCRKWRRLPSGSIVDDQSKWYCRMNPDTRYNACDVDEEIYDECKEILIAAAADGGRDSKGRGTRVKRRKKDDTQKRSVAALIAELLKRRQWCEMRRKDNGNPNEWKMNEWFMLKAHAPDLADLLIQSTDALSAASYAEYIGTRIDVQEIHSTQIAILEIALNQMEQDIEATLKKLMESTTI